MKEERERESKVKTFDLRLKKLAGRKLQRSMLGYICAQRRGSHFRKLASIHANEKVSSF
jgi:hypothetical protein